MVGGGVGGWWFQSSLRHDEVATISDVCGRNQVLHHREGQQGGPPASELEQVGHEEHLRGERRRGALISQHQRHQRENISAELEEEVWKQMHSLRSRPPAPPGRNQPGRRWGGACGRRPGTGRCRRTS